MTEDKDTTKCEELGFSANMNRKRAITKSTGKSGNKGPKSTNLKKALESIERRVLDLNVLPSKRKKQRQPTP